MRIAMNKKAICIKDQMASGTNVSKLCSRRVCSRRVCSRRVCSRRVCSRRVCSRRVCSRRVCSRRALERFGGSASYLQIKGGCLPFLS